MNHTFTKRMADYSKKRLREILVELAPHGSAGVIRDCAVFLEDISNYGIQAAISRNRYKSDFPEIIIGEYFRRQK